MSTIRIVAEMIVKAEYRDELLPLLQALVTGSRAESGNIEYELTQDLDTPNHLFVIETWASEEAIAEHNQSPHFQAYIKGCAGKIEHKAVTKLKKIL